MKLAPLLCAIAILAAVACYGQKPPGMSMTTSLPGTGFGINELGKIDPGGATQLNIPIGYTMSEGQFGLSLWGGQAGGEGFNLQSGLSLGFMEPGQGMSGTLVATDTHNPLTGHIQKQVWRETGGFPAISAGVLDVSGNVERSYYVAATKRLGKAPHLEPDFMAASAPHWPARHPRISRPSTWGVMILSQGFIEQAPGPTERNEFVVPQSAEAPVLDGMLGDDWLDAGQVKLKLPRGEEFLLGAKRVGDVLYVTAAVAPERELTPGATAELCFEVPRAASHILSDQHVKYKLEWVSRHAAPLLSKASPVAGRWVEGPTEPVGKSETCTGCCGDAGDGVWRYPVFEFAIPLADIGAAPDEERIGFCAIVKVPAVVPKRRIAKKDEVIPSLRWPLPKRVELTPTREIFQASPDFWGSIVFRQKTGGRERIAAPDVPEPPTLDGELSKGEWDGADERRISNASGAEQTVYVQRTERAVYVAVVATAMDGPRRNQDLTVYIDAYGDGGLYPRSDDRALRFTQTDEGLKLQAQSWDEKRKLWRGNDEGFCEAVVKPSETLEGSMTVAEVRIPFSSLRFARVPGADQKMGLGIETELRPALTRLAKRRRIESGAGDSTYVTVAWGSGIYHHKVLYGLSHPIGSYRAMAEYDGDQINVGLTGGLFGSENIRLTVGWNGVNDPPDSGPIVGTAFTTRF